MEGHRVAVKLAAIVCDAPAKAYVLGVKGHSRYFSCTRCTIEGDFLQGRICFPELDAPLWTIETVRNETQEGYHLKETVFKKLPIDLVLQIPLHYMHLVCLGAVRKLSILWLRGEKDCRIGCAARDAISLANVEIEPYVCSEFNRRPRSLSKLDRWKANEFRMIVLYTGPIILHSKIPEHLFANFMALQVAVTILCSPKHSHSAELVDYAERLLIHFERTFASLYGPHCSHPGD